MRRTPEVSCPAIEEVALLLRIVMFVFISQGYIFFIVFQMHTSIRAFLAALQLPTSNGATVVTLGLRGAAI